MQRQGRQRDTGRRNNQQMAGFFQLTGSGRFGTGMQSGKHLGNP
jgi:hypothetical protein